MNCQDYSAAVAKPLIHAKVKKNNKKQINTKIVQISCLIRRHFYLFV